MLPFLAGFDQIAYVTTDLARACATFGDYGIPRFHIVERDLDVAVRGERGTMRLKLGFAAIGAVEIELIEPCGGQVEIYTEALPQDGRFAIALHHLRVRVTGTRADWERIFAHFRAETEDEPKQASLATYRIKISADALPNLARVSATDLCALTPPPRGHQVPRQSRPDDIDSGMSASTDIVPAQLCDVPRRGHTTDLQNRSVIGRRLRVEATYALR
jgi:hypothetical protein